MTEEESRQTTLYEFELDSPRREVKQNE